MTAVLGVGVIGASPPTSWAHRSHIPALAVQPGLRLAAVSTSNRESAARAAVAYGVPAHADAAALIADPDVEIVVVAVRVPTHRDLVGAALAAGKPVYCEWPLGIDHAEAALIAEAAAMQGVPAAIGLQARSSPVLRALRAAIADGVIGSVESVSATAFSGRGSVPVSPSKEYLFDCRSGANTLTIEGGHLIDALCFLFGEPEVFSGRAWTRRSVVPTDDGGSLAATAPDTVSISALFPGGAPTTVHLAQGSAALFRTDIVVTGSAGALRIRTLQPGGIQMAPLEVLRAQGFRGEFEPFALAREWYAVSTPATSSSLNVAEALHAFGIAVAGGAPFDTDFAHAVRRHALLEQLAGD